MLLQVMRLIRLAEVKAKELSGLLQASLKAHDVERVQARIRRHHQTAAAPKLQGRAVTILNSDAVSGQSIFTQTTGFVRVSNGLSIPKPGATTRLQLRQSCKAEPSLSSTVFQVQLLCLPA